ncbi:MAG: hypothetical protein KDD56_04100 [Bdellovibrionales bacterium]|nr:hypothetical protein [Bdellovibrionales bacterium]
MRRNIICCLSTAIFTLFFVINPALAATIVVDTNDDFVVNDGNCSIREAFASANQDLAYDNCTAGNGADIIELPGGVINLSDCVEGAVLENDTMNPGLPYDDTFCGDLNLSDETIVNGNGTILNGSEGTRVLSIDRGILIFIGLASEGEECLSEVDVTLNNFTIQNGMSCDGAGIYNDLANLTLNDMNVLNNVSYPYCRGAGIYSEWNLTLNNSTVSGNTGYYVYGGGIFISPRGNCNDLADASETLPIEETPENPKFLNLVLNNSSVDNNCVDSETNVMNQQAQAMEINEACAVGGGIAAEGTNGQILNGSTVNSNKAMYEGAGIAWYFGNLTINDSHVDKNEVGSDNYYYYTGEGAGISYYGLSESEYYGRNEYCIDDEDDDEDIAEASEDLPPLPTRVLSIVNSTVSGNSAQYYAGGILAGMGNLEVINSTVDANTSGFSVGGINFIGTYDYCTDELLGTFDLHGSTVSNNSAPFTGGIANYGGLFTGINSTISTNSGQLGGGGGYYQAVGPELLKRMGSASVAQANDENRPNRPSMARAIEAVSTETESTEVTFGVFNNSTIHLNSTETITQVGDPMEMGMSYDCSDAAYFSQGGGMSIVSGKVEIENTILAGNIDGEACANFNPDDMSDDTANGEVPTGYSANVYAPDAWVFVCETPEDMDNDTSTAEIPPFFDCGFITPASIVSNGFNLVGDPSGFEFTPIDGDQVGTPETPLDPQLGPLQDNGGSTFTHAPLVGSPAVDAGAAATSSSQLRAAIGCEGEDQRGVARAQSGTPTGAARCDIGAVEAEFDFGCNTSDLAPIQLEMDGGLSELESLVKKSSRQFRKAGGSRKQTRSFRDSANALYLAGWTATWIDLPSNALSCSGNTGSLCVNASTTSATGGYTDASDQLRLLANKVAKKAKKKGARVKLKKFKKQTQSLHDGNVATSSGVPSNILVC